MKKTLLTNFIFVVVGLVVTIGISYAYAGIFKDAQRNAPYANMEIPLHAGFDQVKNAGLSVGTFAAYQDAYFDQSAFLRGIVYGGIPGNTNSTVALGSATAPVGVAAVGDVAVAGNFQSDSLKNANGGAPVCADGTGKFYLCAVTGSTTTTTGGGSTTTIGNSQVNTTNHPTLTKVFDTSNGIGVDSQGNTLIGYYYHSTNNGNPQVQTLVDRLVSQKSCQGTFGGAGTVCSIQLYTVGATVFPGNTYTLTSPASNPYSMTQSPGPQFSATATAVQNDTPTIVTQKLALALGNTVANNATPLVIKTVLHNIATYTYPGGIYASIILYQDNTILVAIPTGSFGAKSQLSVGSFTPSVTK